MAVAGESLEARVAHVVEEAVIAHRAAVRELASIQLDAAIARIVGDLVGEMVAPNGAPAQPQQAELCTRSGERPRTRGH